MQKLFYLFRNIDEFVEYLEFYKIENFQKTVRCEELFDIEFINFISKDLLQNIDLVITTSPVSSRILTRYSKQLIDKEICVIGNRAAEQLKNSGCNNIKYIAPNVKDLIIFLNRTMRKKAREKRILYVRGDLITFDIKKYYMDFLKIEEIILYKLIYKTKFSNEFTIDLISRNIEKLGLFSCKSTREFLRICVEKGIDSFLSNLEIFVMNKQSAELLQNFCQRIEIVNAEGLAGIVKNYLSS